MKLIKVQIHNYRSIIDAEFEAHDYLMFVGANNAGKSNVINALRTFYDDLKWSEDDFPKIGSYDDDAWIKLLFILEEEEWANLADKYKEGLTTNSLELKRYFKGSKVQAKQSNVYGFCSSVEEEELFYGAKNISTAKCGSVVYIPALTTPGEQMKTTGPSPLRNMLNFMLKKVVGNSNAYTKLGEAFTALNTEANAEDGFLSTISSPINSALKQWNIKIDLSVNPISPEEISKSLVKYGFIDILLGETALDLERFGHGFQRSVIYELIRIAPSFQDNKEPKKKEFNPCLILLLFEEPEAFLHPSQQENMAYHLRRLGKEKQQQVFITTHSPIFAGKTGDEMCHIVRLHKCDGVTKIFQIKKSQREALLLAGGDFLSILQEYVSNPDIPESKKKEANKLILNAPRDTILAQHERFRYQLWLDSERASMFFAEKVLLVEGATEKALFNYLLANNWHDLTYNHIFVVDALGKFNFHRFLSLFEAFGIMHGVMFDNDNENNEHKVINQFIRDKQNDYTLAEPFEFNHNLETHLHLELPGRDDQKPLQILKAIEDFKLSVTQLSELRKAFCDALAIVEPQTEPVKGLI